MDVHDNVIRHIPDDAIEPDGHTINLRAWHNRIEDASVILSIAPLEYGPVYLFRNEGWRLGTHGVPLDAAGHSTYGGSNTSPLFKYSGVSTPHGRAYILHNTFWTDPSVTSAPVLGGARYGTSGSSNESVYLRNNIIHTTHYAFDVVSAAMWDEDYNSLTTSNKTRGLHYAGKVYTTDMAAYRTASKQGAHTNVGSDFVTGPALRNPQAGDLTLPAGAPLIDAGVPVPNLSDRPGVDFQGKAPDLGATEAGGSGSPLVIDTSTSVSLNTSTTTATATTSTSGTSNSGPSTAPATNTVRVNTGGGAYTDADGNVWSADTGFSGGSTSSTTASIAGTTDQPLYRNDRYGKTFAYNFSVPNGTYSVTLKFAENYWTAAGKRKFNVALNGTTVLSSFDIFAAAGAKNKAVDKTFTTSVTNGTLAIGFTTALDNAKIDAIQIVPVA
jgi:hypothetical protein